MNHLNSVALHITNICSHNCPMCYATNQTQIKRESDLDTLEKIAIKLKKADVEEINLVGGDPCEYSYIEELLKYLSSLGFSLPFFQILIIIRTLVLKELHLKLAHLKEQFMEKMLKFMMFSVVWKELMII